MVKKITLKNMGEIEKLVRDDVLLEAMEENKAILSMPSSFSYSLKGKIVLLGHAPKAPEAPRTEGNPTVPVPVAEVIKYEIGQTVLCENTNVTEVHFSEENKNGKKYYLINKKDIILILQ